MANHNAHYIVGTSENKCRCGSWLAHWRKSAGASTGDCAVRGCTAAAAHGAHVRDRDGRTGDGGWIVPLCAGHNNRAEVSELVLVKAAVLVDAAVGRTAGVPSPHPGGSGARSDFAARVA